LSRFNFVLKHVTSKSIGQASQAKRVERDNGNQVMLKMSSWRLGQWKKDSC